MDNTNGMGYDELIELQDKVYDMLKKFNPVRLKMKWKRCGHKDCQCGSGPSDGSWGNLHGPYVFAQFVDNDLGKIRTVSLGRHYDENALYDIMERGLDFSHYYKVDPGKLELMTPDEKRKHMCRFFLDDEDFEVYHGIKRVEDTMGRYDVFYGTVANRDAYEAASRDLDEQKLATMHRWAIVHGIGSIKGQMTLKGLLAGKYYLKV